MLSRKWHCAASCDGERKTLTKRDAKTNQALEISVCLKCGLVQLSEFPTVEGLRQYYSHHYREDYKGSFTPKPKHIFRAARAARDRLTFLKSRLVDMGHPLPNTLLDIGAGGGEFVYAAKCIGLDAVGIEPNLGYSDFARDSYSVHIDTLHLDQVCDRKADVVTLFHVLEHIPNPIEVIKTLYEIVKEDGWLFVEVPNIEQADASPSNIFFQAHLFYFSEVNLIAVASSYFEPVYTDTKGNLRILLKRRKTPIPPRLPRAEQVQQTLRRLDQKGWFEYLTLGGGLWKPARRIRQYWMESRLGGLTPREIVEKALRA